MYYQKKIEILAQDDINVEFMWIPSHVGIDGNKTADQLAKDAVGELDYEIDHNYHPKEPKRKIMAKLMNEWQEK